MRADKAFIDTNIYLYYQSSNDLAKHKISLDTINFFDCVISTQVLNEICNILTRKYPTPLPEIKRFLLDIINTSDLVLITPPIIIKALELKENPSFSFFDSLMVSAALEANCTYLISEDMQDGLIIDKRLQVVNIYQHTDLLER